MNSTVQVTVHRSQFPHEVTAELIRSLETRLLNHKFHYDSPKQARKWLALHEAYSPARTDPQCLETYGQAFHELIRQISEPFALTGLGCGGGQKDLQLAQALPKTELLKAYVPCDVSVALAITARNRMKESFPSLDVHPLACDLLNAPDLWAVLGGLIGNESWRRVITFFGMIPNFEPETILPVLRAAMRQGDLMLFSANLAPGADYLEGVQRVLPLYKNALTEDWLMTVLLDVGIEAADGRLEFSIEPCPSLVGVSRIEANFIFDKNRVISVFGHNIEFRASESIRVFFSYRYTPQMIRDLLLKHGIEPTNQWITDSGEEGVFKCQAI